ncbi:MAG: hypothetical protein AAFR16_04525 [Pseudomonadota bacterium]
MTSWRAGESRRTAAPRRRPGRRAASLAALAAAAAALGAPAPARAIDCDFGGCTDVARLPPGSVDMAEIVRRAQGFFETDAKVYIVSSARVQAVLPYMLPRQPPFVARNQIHIPEIYHAVTELKYGARPHFVWHYIIGHEMAHAHQKDLRLVEAMSAPIDSVVIAELHADFLAGFFMARNYALSAAAVEELLREIQDLPAGQPGEQDYHGAPGERFFAATQGALYALARPAPTLRAASAQGVRCVFDIIAARTAAGRGSELCVAPPPR